jgi:hypothetical protein
LLNGKIDKLKIHPAGNNPEGWKKPD